MTKPESYQQRSDPFWNPVFSFLEERSTQRFIVPPLRAFKHYDNVALYYELLADVEGYDYFVLHKGMLLTCDFSVLDLILTRECVYANSVFVIYNLNKEAASHAESVFDIHTRSVHEEYAAAKADSIDPQKVIFLHIPKCAGTALYDSLKKQRARCLYFSGHKKDLHKFPYGFDHLNIVAGHFGRLDIVQRFAEGTDIEWVTVLRDPLERLLSEIQHARRSTIENIGPSKIEMRTKEIFEILDSTLFFDNMHRPFVSLANRRREDICENNLLDVAHECLDFLRQGNVIFGFQDRVSDISRLLNMKLGYSLEIPKRLNVAQDNKYERSMEDASRALDQIKEKLAVDLWFFGEAQKIHAQRYAGLLGSKIFVDGREFAPRFKFQGPQVDIFGPYCPMSAGLYAMSIESKTEGEIAFDIYSNVGNTLFCSEVISTNTGSRQFHLPNIHEMEIRLHRVPREMLPVSVTLSRL